MKERQDWVFNHFPQEKFELVQSADLVFILVTEQEEEIRSNQVKKKKKSNTTGNDLQKTDLDKTKETPNGQPS